MFVYVVFNSVFQRQQMADHIFAGIMWKYWSGFEDMEETQYLTSGTWVVKAVAFF